MLIEGSEDPRATELAIRSVAARLDMGDEQIRKALDGVIRDVADKRSLTLIINRSAVLLGADAWDITTEVKKALLVRTARSDALTGTNELSPQNSWEWGDCGLPKSLWRTRLHIAAIILVRSGFMVFCASRIAWRLLAPVCPAYSPMYYSTTPV